MRKQITGSAAKVHSFNKGKEIQGFGGKALMRRPTGRSGMFHLYGVEGQPKLVDFSGIKTCLKPHMSSSSPLSYNWPQIQFFNPQLHMLFLSVSAGPLVLHAHV